MVRMNRAMMRLPPRLIGTTSLLAAGFSSGTAKCMIAAGTTQLTREGMNRAKKVPKPTIPFCQTIRVVMSPKGLKAPPALAPMTTLMQPRETKVGLERPTARSTAHISSAVVRLSATGEMKKASRPVSQNSLR